LSGGVIACLVCVIISKFLCKNKTKIGGERSMKYAAAYWNSINRMRQLSQQDTFLHRLPAVLKVVLTVLFLVGVLSRGPYELNILFFALAALLLVAGFGNVPLSYLGGKAILALPFVFFLGLSDLMLLRAPAPGMPAVGDAGSDCLHHFILKMFFSCGCGGAFGSFDERRRFNTSRTNYASS
jgi:energy-coupling factor transporter transmembrane protein EcfT